MCGWIAFDFLWLMGSWENLNRIYYENYTVFLFTATECETYETKTK